MWKLILLSFFLAFSHCRKQILQTYSIMFSAKPVLTYFDARGVIEPTRIMFAIKNVEFTVSIPEAQGRIGTIGCVYVKRICGWHSSTRKYAANHFADVVEFTVPNPFHLTTPLHSTATSTFFSPILRTLAYLLTRSHGLVPSLML